MMGSISEKRYAPYVRYIHISFHRHILHSNMYLQFKHPGYLWLNKTPKLFRKIITDSDDVHKSYIHLLQVMV